MKRLRKAFPFIAIAVAAIVIPVLAATLPGAAPAGAADTTSDVSLDLVLLVNRMELTKDQMQALRDILVDLVGQRSTLQTALEEKKTAFEAEMIAFTGTAAELDARLETHRTEVKALVASRRDARAAALEKLGTLLSYKQGMLLEQVLPRLDGSLAGDLQGMLGTGPDARLRLIGQGMAQPSSNPDPGASTPVGMNGRFGRGSRTGSTASEDQARLGQACPQMEGNGGVTLAAPYGQRMALRVLSGRLADRMGAGPEGGEEPSLLEGLIRVLELKLGQA